MIEIVSSSRCVSCDVCIKVCPMDVFDRGGDGIPVIARQSQCQTCFMCEAYCPADALFVAPLSAPAPAESGYLDEDALTAAGALGAYRRSIGWGPGRTPGSALDANHLFTSRITGPTTRPDATVDSVAPAVKG
jgi:NAD-dependent dihydropyrimidine dehydrogenase PreA subunit